MNKSLEVVGQAPEGKIVVKNIFQMAATDGIPLGIILEVCRENNMVIDWIDYFHSGVASGMNPDRILNRISIETEGVAGEEYSKSVVNRLKLYIANGCKV